MIETREIPSIEEIQAILNILIDNSINYKARMEKHEKEGTTDSWFYQLALEAYTKGQEKIKSITKGLAEMKASTLEKNNMDFSLFRRGEQQSYNLLLEAIADGTATKSYINFLEKFEIVADHYKMSKGHKDFAFNNFKSMFADIINLGAPLQMHQSAYFWNEEKAAKIWKSIQVPDEEKTDSENTAPIIDTGNDLYKRLLEIQQETENLVRNRKIHSDNIRTEEKGDRPSKNIIQCNIESIHKIDERLQELELQTKLNYNDLIVDYVKNHGGPYVKNHGGPGGKDLVGKSPFATAAEAEKPENETPQEKIKRCIYHLNNELKECMNFSFDILHKAKKIQNHYDYVRKIENKLEAYHEMLSFFE